MVTPGPWHADTDDLGIWIQPDASVCAVAKICTKSKEHDHVANAQYIARLNPETMKLVVEALERAEFMHKDFPVGAKCREALEALNRNSP